jgi:hypothetical protein
MSYRVVEDDKLNKIVEKETDLVVAKIPSSRQARKLCRSLNLGSGFNGFTPMFFTLEYKQTKKAPT